MSTVELVYDFNLIINYEFRQKFEQGWERSTVYVVHKITTGGLPSLGLLVTVL
jgi:hypothetical protein